MIFKSQIKRALLHFTFIYLFAFNHQNVTAEDEFSFRTTIVIGNVDVTKSISEPWYFNYIISAFTLSTGLPSHSVLLFGFHVVGQKGSEISKRRLSNAVLGSLKIILQVKIKDNSQRTSSATYNSWTSIITETISSGLFQNKLSQEKYYFKDVTVKSTASFSGLESSDSLLQNHDSSNPSIQTLFQEQIEGETVTSQSSFSTPSPTIEPTNLILPSSPTSDPSESSQSFCFKNILSSSSSSTTLSVNDQIGNTFILPTGSRATIKYTWQHAKSSWCESCNIQLYLGIQGYDTKTCEDTSGAEAETTTLKYALTLDSERSRCYYIFASEQYGYYCGFYSLGVVNSGHIIGAIWTDIGLATDSPSQTPSSLPSLEPTQLPTTTPTHALPTAVPSRFPSAGISLNPTPKPFSRRPTHAPTTQPTTESTSEPSPPSPSASGLTSSLTYYQVNFTAGISFHEIDVLSFLTEEGNSFENIRKSYQSALGLSSASVKFIGFDAKALTPSLTTSTTPSGDGDGAGAGGGGVSSLGDLIVYLDLSVTDEQFGYSANSMIDAFYDHNDEVISALSESIPTVVSGTTGSISIVYSNAVIIRRDKLRMNPISTSTTSTTSTSSDSYRASTPVTESVTDETAVAATDGSKSTSSSHSHSHSSAHNSHSDTSSNVQSETGQTEESQHTHSHTHTTHSTSQSESEKSSSDDMNDGAQSHSQLSNMYDSSVSSGDATDEAQFHSSSAAIGTSVTAAATASSQSQSKSLSSSKSNSLSSSRAGTQNGKEGGGVSAVSVQEELVQQEYIEYQKDVEQIQQQQQQQQGRVESRSSPTATNSKTTTDSQSQSLRTVSSKSSEPAGYVLTKEVEDDEDWMVASERGRIQHSCQQCMNSANFTDETVTSSDGIGFQLYGYRNNWFDKDGHSTTYTIIEPSSGSELYTGQLCKSNGGSPCEIALPPGQYIWKVSGAKDPNRDLVAWQFCGRIGGAVQSFLFTILENGICIPESNDSFMKALHWEEQHSGSTGQDTQQAFKMMNGGEVAMDTASTSSDGERNDGLTSGTETETKSFQMMGYIKQIKWNNIKAYIGENLVMIIIGCVGFVVVGILLFAGLRWTRRLRPLQPSDDMSQITDITERNHLNDEAFTRFLAHSLREHHLKQHHIHASADFHRGLYKYDGVSI